MLEGIDIFFSKMIGTLAVILLVSAFLGGSDFFSKFKKSDSKIKYSLIAGLIGGVFGIYGNYAGVAFNGAVISVRDIGPMIAGFTGGPVGGILAGAIAGVHRLTMGGITAYACVVATCLIGLICGFISSKNHSLLEKPLIAFIIGLLMETGHLGIVLLMVKPFQTAWDIVRQIAIPFLLVNGLGFGLMVSIMSYTKKQRELSLEKSRLQSELETANTIQRSMLPTINDTYPGRHEVDVGAFMQAAKAVGGDFYDVFFVDNNHLAFVIGDVSGKGVPAALFMASSKTILQNCIRDIPSLVDAVATANNVLCERNDAEMFVTAWIGILDLTSFEMVYTSAGHNPPVLIREGNAELLSTKSCLVLAGMEMAKYREHTMQLQKGDIMLLYTDGVVEAENILHELYDECRLLDCLHGIDDKKPSAIIEKVCESVNTFAGEADQFDDMTMLCFEINKDIDNTATEI